MTSNSGPQRLKWFRPVRISRKSQQEADRRAGDSLVSLLDQTEKEEITALLARGDYILAVRRVRELTGLRLVDAKRVTESLQERLREQPT